MMHRIATGGIAMHSAINPLTEPSATSIASKNTDNIIASIATIIQIIKNVFISRFLFME